MDAEAPGERVPQRQQAKDAWGLRGRRWAIAEVGQEVVTDAAAARYGGVHEPRAGPGEPQRQLATGHRRRETQSERQQTVDEILG